MVSIVKVAASISICEDGAVKISPDAPDKVRVPDDVEKFEAAAASIVILLFTSISIFCSEVITASVPVVCKLRFELATVKLEVFPDWIFTSPIKFIPFAPERVRIPLETVKLLFPVESIATPLVPAFISIPPVVLLFVNEIAVAVSLLLKIEIVPFVVEVPPLIVILFPISNLFSLPAVNDIRLSWKRIWVSSSSLWYKYSLNPASPFTSSVYVGVVVAIPNFDWWTAKLLFPSKFTINLSSVVNSIKPVLAALYILEPDDISSQIAPEYTSKLDISELNLILPDIGFDGLSEVVPEGNPTWEVPKSFIFPKLSIETPG